MSRSPSPPGEAPPVLRADAGGVTKLTLNRPERFNPLGRYMLDALHAALGALAVDPTVRVVVVAGAGRAFCAGHDLKEMLARCDEEFLDGLFARCSEVMLAIRDLPQPVIAQVHGVAAAAGCQLVAACDLAVAADDARFATSGINLGLFCATPAVALSRTIASKRAFEMLFTGDFIDAPTALDWGLVNRVVPADGLAAATAALAARLVEKPRAVVAEGKRLFHAQLGLSPAGAYALAERSIVANMLGSDAREGVAAFLGKRRPAWRE